MNDSGPVAEDGQVVAGQVKDISRRPEDVFVVGNVVKVLVADANGSVDILFFRTDTDAKAYLGQQYSNAREATGTRFFALDSLDPFVPPNQYVISSAEVWSTSSSTTEEPFQQIATAFIDKNLPQAQSHQRSLKQQTSIGVWKNADEAVTYYSSHQPNKTIRDARVLGNAATNTNLVKPNEIYLQTRPVTAPAVKT